MDEPEPYISKRNIALDGLAVSLTVYLFYLVYIVTIVLWIYEPISYYVYPKNNIESKFPDNTSSGIWLDFVADTGDGWDSTFVVATTLAQPKLIIDNITLPRATTLVVGGDITYPYPTAEGLQQNFIAPFTAALQPFHTYTWVWSWLTLPITLPEELDLEGIQDGTENKTFWANRIEPLILPEQRSEMANWCHPVQVITAILEKLFSVIGNHPGFRPFKRWSEEEHGISTTKQKLEFEVPDWLPEMFLIPGNHDSLDGFAAFARLLERPSVGGWKLKQTRHYFVLEKEKWVILGIHDQHAAGCAPDIDMEQLQFFLNSLYDRRGYKTMLMLHSPFWSLGRNPGDYLSRLFEYLGDSLVAIVAGDMHYYSHHIPQKNGPHLIVSGGGGAFLHSTYSIPNELNITLHSKSGVLEYKLHSSYPEPITSVCRLRNLRNNSIFVILALMFSFWVYYFHYYAMGALLLASWSSTHNWYSVMAVAAVLACFPAVKRAVDATLPPWFDDTRFTRLLSVTVYCVLASLFVITIFAPLLHFIGVLDQMLYGPLGDPDYKNFIRFHFMDEQVEAFVIGLRQAFPKNMEFQTAFDVDITGERADALGQRYADVVDKKWFQNNMVLVEAFTMESTSTVT